MLISKKNSKSSTSFEGKMTKNPTSFEQTLIRRIENLEQIILKMLVPKKVTGRNVEYEVIDFNEFIALDDDIKDLLNNINKE